MTAVIHFPDNEMKSMQIFIFCCCKNIELLVIPWKSLLPDQMTRTWFYL